MPMRHRPMRTIGFRANVLFIVAAAFGLVAALGRSWYGPGAGRPAEDAGRRRPGRSRGLPARARVHRARAGTTGWDAFTRMDSMLAALAGRGRRRSAR